MTHTRSIHRSAIAIALAAITGAALAQSPANPSSPSSPTAQPSSPMTSPSANTAAPQNGASTAARMPLRTEPAESAYSALDKSNRGYLQKSDVESLQGFSFEQADVNADGRISKEEFTRYWSAKPAK